MNLEVQAQLNWFIANPEYLTRVFKRGALYLPHIVEHGRQRGPSDGARTAAGSRERL